MVMLEESQIPEWMAALDEWLKYLARKRAAKNSTACSSVPATLDDRYARRLASWSRATDGLCRPLKPPKPNYRHLSQASVEQRTSAYKEALLQWECKHQQWQIANAKRKAQARAVRDARRRVQKRAQK